MTTETHGGTRSAHGSVYVIYDIWNKNNFASFGLQSVLNNFAANYGHTPTKMWRLNSLATRACQALATQMRNSRASRRFREESECDQAYFCASLVLTLRLTWTSRRHTPDMQKINIIAVRTHILATICRIITERSHGSLANCSAISHLESILVLSCCELRWLGPH